MEKEIGIDSMITANYDVFRALDDPIRGKIVELLNRKGPFTCKSLGICFFNSSQGTGSHLAFWTFKNKVVFSPSNNFCFDKVCEIIIPFKEIFAHHFADTIEVGIITPNTTNKKEFVIKPEIIMTIVTISQISSIIARTK